MAKKNEGKRFEEDIEKSVPADWFFYRLKDSSGSWSNDKTKSRFTPKNMSDHFIFNTDDFILWAIEEKSFKGKSMPWGNMNDKNDKKLIRMSDMCNKHNCFGAYFFNFRDLGETYMVYANVLKVLKANSTRKSLSLIDAKTNGQLIPQELKIKRYKYDLQTVL